MGKYGASVGGESTKKRQFFWCWKNALEVALKSVWMLRIATFHHQKFLPLCSGFYLAQFCTLELSKSWRQKE